jgi:DNA-binding beta-propeller fold protein YncE
MNAMIPILSAICILASALPVHSASLLTQWATEDQADCIAIGPGGEVYVNINQNHKVVKYSSEGERVTEWEIPGVIETNGIAVGPDGNVYVNINQNHKVLKYSPEGEMLDEWSVDGQMTDLAIGPNGLVYVSFANGLIQVFGA